MEYRPLINYGKPRQQPEVKPCWYAIGYVVFTVAVIVLLIAGLIKRGVL